MTPAFWTALLLCGFGAGAALCGWLVVPQRLTVLTASGAIVGALGAGGSLVALLSTGTRPDAAAAALVLCILTGLGGYALVAALLAGSHRPDRGRPAPVAPEVSADGTAFCLLADAEPSEYTPSAVTAALAALESSDVQLPREALRPLVYLAERIRYVANGTSPAQGTAAAIAARMRPFLGIAPMPCWCATPPTLPETVRAARAAGARRVVVVMLSVAETRLTDAAIAEAATPGEAPLLVTPPMWGRSVIADHVAAFVLEAVRSAPGRTGVILAGNGQPAEWDRSHPQAREQETYFCQRVRALVAGDGVPDDDIRTAWVEWTEPTVTDTARHLAALGCERIVVVPAAMPFDSLATRIDLKTACEEAASETSVPVELLPAWGDTEVVARTLAEMALEVLAEDEA